MIFLVVCINFGPALQGDGWVGGGEEWGGRRQKPPGENTGPSDALR